MAAASVGWGVVASADSGALDAGSWPCWACALAGFAVGAAVSAGATLVCYQRPLARAGRVCRRVESGDLSETVPESGPSDLRALARVLNTLLADFQEVLLLFAYLLRSARTSMHLLHERVNAEAGDNASRSLAATILDDLSRMQEMVEGFKYFRVRIESGTITDTGLRPANGRAAAAAHAAARPSAPTAPGVALAGEKETSNE